MTVSQPRASLYGLGGVGYCSFVPDLPQAILIRRRKTQIVDVIPLVKSWLEEKDAGQWLMVVDNADDYQLFFGRPAEVVDASASSYKGNLGNYLPECAHGSILVTTRTNRQA